VVIHTKYVIRNIRYKNIKGKWNQIAAIEVNDKLYKDKIIVVYHSSSSSNANFTKFLEDVVEESMNRRDCNGDF